MRSASTFTNYEGKNPFGELRLSLSKKKRLERLQRYQKINAMQQLAATLLRSHIEFSKDLSATVYMVYAT